MPEPADSLTDWLKQNPATPFWLRELIALFVDLPAQSDDAAAAATWNDGYLAGWGDHADRWWRKTSNPNKSGGDVTDG
jgi:hypothetical protein